MSYRCWFANDATKRNVIFKLLDRVRVWCITNSKSFLSFRNFQLVWRLLCYYRRYISLLCNIRPWLRTNLSPVFRFRCGPDSEQHRIGRNSTEPIEGGLWSRLELCLRSSFGFYRCLLKKACPTTSMPMATVLNRIFFSLCLFLSFFVCWRMKDLFDSRRCWTLRPPYTTRKGLLLLVKEYKFDSGGLWITHTHTYKDKSKSFRFFRHGKQARLWKI